MSLHLRDLQPVPLNENALDMISAYAVEAIRDLVTCTIVSTFFGVSSLLALISVCILLHKGWRLTSVRILLAATITLYASTCVFFSYNMLYIYSVNRLASSASQGLFSPDFVLDIPGSVGRVEALLYCSVSATLAANIFISDAVVWWRALALWPGNRYVRLACFATLSTILALGIRFAYTARPTYNNSAIPPLSDAFGFSCVIISLATNTVSTSLIAYKAWEHRCFIGDHLGRKGKGSQVLGVLSFLVESGTIYCAFWVTIAVYNGLVISPDSYENRTEGLYMVVLSLIIDTCLVPLVAIYPMVIVLIVALNSSPLECVSWQSINGTARQSRSVIETSIVFATGTPVATQVTLRPYLTLDIASCQDAMTSGVPSGKEAEGIAV